LRSGNASLLRLRFISPAARFSAFTDAARFCVEQLVEMLGVVRDVDLVVAYEPVWAIGRSHPAPPEHVREVCRALRRCVDNHTQAARLLYGGSAGEGTFASLYPDVDGLFLGRFAHEIGRLDSILEEVASHAPRPTSAVKASAKN